MSAYYNEIDPFAAEWLRALISKGLIPDGEVDTRSIVDVRPDDLRDFAQCHFFAGIGGWVHALRLAGWADERPIWTGSCPCQPFSVAGKGRGTADERHLWPVFHSLIRECRPPVVMGEQVAGAAGYGWFDGVAADLEAQDYACRALDLAACSIDAPHIRQRLWWCAIDLGNADSTRWQARDAFSIGDAPRSGKPPRSGSYNVEHTARVGRGEGRAEHEVRSGWPAAPGAGRSDMGNADFARLEGREPAAERAGEQPVGPSGLADADSCGRAGRQEAPERSPQRRDVAERVGGDVADADDARSPCAGGKPQHEGAEQFARNDYPEEGSFWSDHEWIIGADQKARRVKPGVCLLVDGLPGRVGRLRGYGNAIVPPLAAEVIGALMEVIRE